MTFVDTRLLESATASVRKLENADVRVLESYGTEPPAGVLFSDDFNRADGALGSSWAAVVGSVAISGNKAVPVNTSANDEVRAVIAGIGDDQWCEANITAGDTYTWLVVRGNTTFSNRYAFVSARTADGGAWTLIKTVGGGDTTLDTGAPGSGITGLYRMEAQGTTLRGYINGTKVCEVTDASLTTGDVGFGFYTTSAGGSVDNFRGGDLPYTPLGITFVQAKAAPDDNLPVTLDAAVTAGNALIVAADAYWNSVTVPEISDNRGNTYTMVCDARDPGDLPHAHRVWVCLNAAAGSTTVTPSMVGSGGSGFATLHVAEFSGIATASAIDIASSPSYGDSSTPTAAATGTMAAAGELVYASMGHAGGTQSITEDTADGFVLTSEAEGGDFLNASAVQHKITTAPTSVTPNWTTGGSQRWIADRIVFKPLSGGPAWLYDFTALPDGAVPSTFRKGGGQDGQIASGFFQSVSGGDWSNYDLVGSTPPIDASDGHIYVSIDVDWRTASGGECGVMYYGDNTNGWSGSRNNITIRQNGTIAVEHESGGFNPSETHAATGAGRHRFDVECDPATGLLRVLADHVEFYEIPSGFGQFRYGASNRQIGIFVQGNSGTRIAAWHTGRSADGWPADL